MYDLTHDISILLTAICILKSFLKLHIPRRHSYFRKEFNMLLAATCTIGQSCSVSTYHKKAKQLIEKEMTKTACYDAHGKRTPHMS